MRYYSNTAQLSTISTPGGISTGSTEVALSTSTGLPSQYPYTLRINADTASEELVSVTGPKVGSPGTFLITRAQDGTTAKAHNFGAPVAHGVSARDLQEPQNHMALTAPASVHGLPASAWENEFTIYKEVDQGYASDISLNDDTVLKVAVDANSKYRIELFAMVSGLGGDIVLAWKFPAGASGLRSVLGPASASTNRDDTNMRIGAHQLATPVAYGLNSSTLYAAIQERFILTVAGTAGTLTLQHAQEVSHADQTVMRGSSYMTVRKLVNN